MDKRIKHCERLRMAVASVLSVHRRDGRLDKKDVAIGNARCCRCGRALDVDDGMVCYLCELKIREMGLSRNE